MQKAKHRTNTVTKVVYVPAYPQNGNGTHANNKWKPGDPVELHPLYSAAGAFKDDPFKEELAQIMKKLRQEELERDLRWLDEAEQEEKHREEQEAEQKAQ